MAEASQNLELEPRHPIQVVARRTGLSTDVIRVWERRYGAVTPERSASSRRLYSDADIARLQLLQQATQSGRRISDVATLADDELRQLITADEKVVERVSARAASPGTDVTALGYIEACKDAIHEAEPVALERALSRASVEYSVPDLFERVIIPLMKDVGHAWQEGEIRVSQEHMATAVVRSFLRVLGNRLLLVEHRNAPGEPVELVPPLIGDVRGFPHYLSIPPRLVNRRI